MADSAIKAGAKRILFVDDDEVMTMLTSVALKRHGHQVTSFSDARDALEAFRRAPQAFDVVVSDIRLGSASGIELSSHMLRIRPDVPILLTSGLILDEDRERARQAGVSAVLPKARVMTDLAAVIEQLLH